MYGKLCAVTAYITRLCLYNVHIYVSHCKRCRLFCNVACFILCFIRQCMFALAQCKCTYIKRSGYKLAIKICLRKVQSVGICGYRIKGQLTCQLCTVFNSKVDFGSGVVYDEIYIICSSGICYCKLMFAIRQFCCINKCAYRINVCFRYGKAYIHIRTHTCRVAYLMQSIVICAEICLCRCGGIVRTYLHGCICLAVGEFKSKLCSLKVLTVCIGHKVIFNSCSVCTCPEP